MSQETTYEKIGGAAAVAQLCERFYQRMAEAPQFAELRAMHPEDLSGSRDKLYKFLSGWLFIVTGHPPPAKRTAPVRLPAGIPSRSPMRFPAFGLSVF